MLIKGNLNSNKTDILIDSCAKLLNQGVSADKILVIVQNFKKKNEFTKKIKEKLEIEALTNLNIYTFFGLVYNKILENWLLVENKIKDDNAKITPNLSGLEVSQYIFKNAIDEIKFKGYNSKVNLLHQLLRRYSLCVLNALTPDEIKDRSRILLDPFYSDIKNALNLYKLKTLNLRAFDYLRQADIFKFIYENTLNSFEYVFLDDGDEITPALFQYLNHIKKDVKEFFIAYDEFGCTRKGFLGALEFDFERFLNEKPVILKPSFKDKKADEIFTAVKNETPVLIENSIKKSFIRQDEMIEDVINQITALLSNPKNRLQPSDISIITPNIDNYLKMQFGKLNYPVKFLSGSGKLSHNPVIGSILEILKILNNKNLKISPYILRGILAKILKTDFILTLKITDKYEVDGEDIFKTLKNFKDNKNIERFLELSNEIKDLKLSEQLFAISNEYIPLTLENKDNIYKINQLLKQIRDFEETFKDSVSNKELIFQLENTIISENPLNSEVKEENAIIVSTAQKIIDNSIKSKHTFILDTTSSNWIKQDIGPLYNAWVFQKSWKKRSFELEDNIKCSLDKTARILRKIYLLNEGVPESAQSSSTEAALNEGKIYIYSSIYDFLGAENFKGINHFFKEPDLGTQTEQTDKKEFKIIPRPDQAPVLEYKEGKMAVSAVAGAGKTTIMLALILKLLNEKVPVQNIFVLTFMDSAARNFKERIKSNFPNLVELPHISTIHGLALRILRENNNHTKVNLDVDFEILDDIKRSNIIKEIISNLGLELTKAELYERAISTYKNQKTKNPDKLSPLFKRIYETYKTTLLSNNYIDYDDLLSLSLSLLQNHKSIREYYQNLMRFIIEDEAQDSSEIQQELIKILSDGHKNLIRCGDINQAITTTFSNADVKGFKKFIEENKNVKMNYSNRNATGIIDFANGLIQFGQTISDSAFLPIETKPVEGKNIIDPNSVLENIFEKEKDEKDFILKKIEEINEKEPNSSIAILLRSNRGVLDWSNYLTEFSTLKFAANSDTLNLNPVFRTVLAALNFIHNPLNNKTVKHFAKTLMELGFYKQDFEILEFLDKLNSPFILGNNEYFSIFWDLKYFLELWNLPIYEIAYKVGEFYFSNITPDRQNPNQTVIKKTQEVKKANIPLVSGIVSKVYNQYKTFEDTIERLNILADKINRTGIKLISDTEEKKNDGTIKILTLHKSKGDEFDYVFIPELYKDNLSLNISDVKLKDNSKFIENIKTNPKNEEELKNEILDENFRLAYVGVTRAKRKLYLSCAMEYKIFNKIREKAPNELFEILNDRTDDIPEEGYYV